jgi:hypothetical protein
VIALVNPIRRDGSATTIDAQRARHDRDDASELPPATAWLAKPTPVPDSDEPGREDSTAAASEQAVASGEQSPTSGESMAGAPRERLATAEPVAADTDDRAAISGEPAPKATRDATASGAIATRTRASATISGEPAPKATRDTTSEPVVTNARDAATSGEPVPTDTRASGEPDPKATHDDATAEPVATNTRDATGEPDPKATRDATGEPDLEATRDATGEPDPEATRDATGEPDPEATRDATGEPDLKATRDATGEPDPKATRDATREPDLKATGEPDPTDTRVSAEPVPGDTAAADATPDEAPASATEAAAASDEPVPQDSTADGLTPTAQAPVDPSDDGAPPSTRTADPAADASAVLHVPNLVAPPGARRAVGKKGERLRLGDAALVMPDLRRPGAPASTDGASESAATLSIPASLIAPTPLPGARRRGSKTGQNPVVPGADQITLNMPRLVREDGERTATPVDAGADDLSLQTDETAATVTDAEASGLLAVAHAALADQATTADPLLDATTQDTDLTVRDGAADGLSAGTGEAPRREHDDPDGRPRGRRHFGGHRRLACEHAPRDADRRRGDHRRPYRRPAGGRGQRPVRSDIRARARPRATRRAGP